MTRFWDHHLEKWIVQILPGEMHFSKADEVISTVLGSCVSACIRDPRVEFGGMNHYMLPCAPITNGAAAQRERSARYGVFALEDLVEGLERRGCRRSRLEVKLFGGGRVIANGTDVGRLNITFAKRYFELLGLAIVAEDLGDTCARRVRYWPKSGRVQLARMEMFKTPEEEYEAQHSTAHIPVIEDLF